MLLCIVSTCKRHIGIHQELGPLAALAPQLGLVVEEDLAFGQLADAFGVSVAGGDEDGVDVRPARSCSTARSVAIRLRTLRT